MPASVPASVTVLCQAAAVLASVSVSEPAAVAVMMYTAAAVSVLMSEAAAVSLLMSGAAAVLG